MFARLSDALRNRNKFSLDSLKAAHKVLQANEKITEANKSLIVETLRSMSEILIWGDQNDSSVFDFFLEKNMLSFFLKILNQKTSRYVKVQLLQTLSILFENIRNETSVYYLLSNNHVNEIIVHKFDFSDEEVLAYYISFLKTLSFKLNTHTINFFINEHLPDFPLYTEAIKFFNNKESMVRVAVRTLTLNVCKVNDRTMLNFIVDKAAAPYFSNLVYFIGKQSLDLDACLQKDADHLRRGKLNELVAEHLDQLHFLNDILSLGVEKLNCVLCNHLLNTLFLPLYVFSLSDLAEGEESQHEKRLSRLAALFLLSQVFSIFTYQPLVTELASQLLKTSCNISNWKRDLAESATKVHTHSRNSSLGNRPQFVPPEATLQAVRDQLVKEAAELKGHLTRDKKTGELLYPGSPKGGSQEANDNVVIDYDENFQLLGEDLLFSQLDNEIDDARVLPALFLMYAITCNQGIHRRLLEAANVYPSRLRKAQKILTELITPKAESRTSSRLPLLDGETRVSKALFEDDDDEEVSPPPPKRPVSTMSNKSSGQENNETGDVEESQFKYNARLVQRILRILEKGVRPDSRTRLITLEIAKRLLSELVVFPGSGVCLAKEHLESLEKTLSLAKHQLWRYFSLNSGDVFLDTFEDELRNVRQELNIEFLMMDETILLPPVDTPLTGVPFEKRLPCGDAEKARHAMKVFMLLRNLLLEVQHLPVDPPHLLETSEHNGVGEVLDLSNTNMIACRMVEGSIIAATGTTPAMTRYLVVDEARMILAEPDTTKLGWGVVRFAALLQLVEVTADKTDGRILHISVAPNMKQRFTMNSNHHVGTSPPSFVGLLVFDDRIRAMTAKQYLERGRTELRNRKMAKIATLLSVNPAGSSSFAWPEVPATPALFSGSPVSAPMFPDPPPIKQLVNSTSKGAPVVSVMRHVVVAEQASAQTGSRRVSVEGAGTKLDSSLTSVSKDPLTMSSRTPSVTDTSDVFPASSPSVEKNVLETVTETSPERKLSSPVPDTRAFEKATSLSSSRRSSHLELPAVVETDLIAIPSSAEKVELTSIDVVDVLASQSVSEVADSPVSGAHTSHDHEQSLTDDEKASDARAAAEALSSDVK